jgi:hypothetical protein
MDTLKRFEDFPTTECDNCERYWINQCDGTEINSKGSNASCNSFLPTRKVLIPQEIETLKKRLKMLEIEVLLMSVITIITSVVLANLFGGK